MVAGHSEISKKPNAVNAQVPVMNPIISKFVQYPFYNAGEIKVKDNMKKDLYMQIREHKHGIQVMQQTDTIQKIVDEHIDVFSPSLKSSAQLNISNLNPLSPNNISASVDQ